MNPLEDESATVLEIVNYDYSVVLGRLEINFATPYDFTQNPSITDPTQTSFVDRNLPFNGIICYRLAFLSENVRVRLTENICIDL